MEGGETLGMEIRYLLSKGFEICYLPEKFYQFYEVNNASKSLIPFKSGIKTSFNQISNSNPKVISSLRTRGIFFVQFESKTQSVISNLCLPYIRKAF